MEVLGKNEKIVVTTNTVSFCLEGRPKPMARYKMGRGRDKWGTGHSYNPSHKDQLLVINKINALLKQNNIPFDIRHEPIALTLIFYYGWPKNHYVRSDRNGVLKDNVPKKWPVVKMADIDNLSKLIMDCLEKSKVIDNDNMVVSLNAKKMYTSNSDMPDGYTTILLEKIMDNK